MRAHDVTLPYHKAPPRNRGYYKMSLYGDFMLTEASPRGIARGSCTLATCLDLTLRNVTKYNSRVAGAVSPLFCGFLGASLRGVMCVGWAPRTGTLACRVIHLAAPGGGAERR